MPDDTKMPEIEAEMRCRRCKGLEWVKFEYRHDGKNPQGSNYSYARCRPCPNGEDKTDWTGRIRIKG